MVEQGLTLYIQQKLAGSPPVTPPPGGFSSPLPENMLSPIIPQAWAYRTITDKPEYVLAGQTSARTWTVQIDCHGVTPADRTLLAYAIRKALRPPFPEVFTDTDATQLNNLYETEASGADFFVEADRSYGRALEFVVEYLQS